MNGEPIRILLIEDNPEDARLLKRIFRVRVRKGGLK